jgi:hypothetical protein
MPQVLREIDKHEEEQAEETPPLLEITFCIFLDAQTTATSKTGVVTFWHGRTGAIWSVFNWVQSKKIKLEFNQIGDKGCAYLAKAQWKHLKKLTIGMSNARPEANLIEERGCAYLSRAFWTSLEQLLLCTTVLI